MFYQFNSPRISDYRKQMNIGCVALAFAIAVLSLLGIDSQIADQRASRAIFKREIDRDGRDTKGFVFLYRHVDHDYDYPSTGDSTTEALYFTYVTDGGREVCSNGPFEWLGDKGPQNGWIPITVNTRFTRCGKLTELRLNEDNKLWKSDVGIRYSASNSSSFYCPELFDVEPGSAFRWIVKVRAVIALVLGSPLVFLAAQLLWFPLVGLPTIRPVRKLIDFLSTGEVYE
jgi:hypothetical protein